LPDNMVVSCLAGTLSPRHPSVRSQQKYELQDVAGKASPSAAEHAQRPSLVHQVLFGVLAACQGWRSGRCWGLWWSNDRSSLSTVRHSSSMFIARKAALQTLSRTTAKNMSCIMSVMPFFKCNAAVYLSPIPSRRAKTRDGNAVCRVAFHTLQIQFTQAALLVEL
jgi:hypothetical protein